MAEQEVQLTKSDQRIESILTQIVEQKKALGALMSETPVIDYLKPALVWNPDTNHFPFKKQLHQTIVDEAGRLYGEGYQTATDDQLNKTWAVETGAHLHLPKRFDKATQKEGFQTTALIFHGQVFWALGNQELGNKLNISLSSGRVPLNNVNSGAYLDLPSLETPITLTSRKKYNHTPEMLIPPTLEPDLQAKQAQLKTFFDQKRLPKSELELAQEVFAAFRSHSGSFSDQVAVSHSLMFDKILPESVNQVTIDSETIGREFLIFLMQNPDSLMYKIFSDPKLFNKFNQQLSGIDTGWGEEETPFDEVTIKEGAPRTINYSGSLDPEVLLKGLQAGTLYPKGAMKFFAMMVEGGLCPIGGMNQSGYCTDIRDKSVSFLHTIGENNRAQALATMPTNIAVISPAWGIQETKEDTSLIDPITSIFNPLNEQDFDKIRKISSLHALTIGAPALYQFILGETPELNYQLLKPLIEEYAVIK